MLTRPARFIVATLVLASLTAPLAAGEGVVSGQAIVRQLAFEQPSDQIGSIAFLHVARDAAGDLQFSATGKHITAVTYVDDGYEAEADGADVSTLRTLNQVQPTPGTQVDADAGHLDLTAASPSLTLNAFGHVAQDLQVKMQSGQQSVLVNPQLTAAGIAEPGRSPVPVDLPASPELSGGGANYWSTRTSALPHVLTQATGAVTLKLSGTFTIEVLGLDLHFVGQGVDQQLHSGTDRTAIQPGMPADTVRAIRVTFVRLEVTDGSMEMVLPDGPVVQWSGPNVETTTGAVSLTDATGSVMRPDGREQRLTGSTYHLDGHYDLQANPSQQGLQLGMTGLDDQGHPLAPNTATVRPVAPPLVWVAVAAAVALGAAATFVTLAVRRRQPTMADLEAALETGHFRRAARDAGRILRKRPGFEDAVISRSIALAKLGQNRRVISEIHAHMAAREPSDGVLHYVLGLAFRALGEIPQAEGAWKEAVRRTPGLLPQVQPLLSGQQGSSAPGPLGPVVDGTAYA